MHQKWILAGTVCAIALGLVAFALHAAPDLGVCQQIRSACLRAGFVPRGASAGNGLKKDCINPMMQGLAERGGSPPLPWISPRVVDACRTADPGFGQPRLARALRDGSRSGHLQGMALNDGEPLATSPSGSAPAAGTAPTASVQSQFPPAATAPVAPPQSPSPPAVIADSTSSTPAASSGRRPNIVFVLTDDLSLNLVQFMPHVLKMQKDGVTFTNYFVTDSLCCPSRSSIFTGRYPHDTGVFTNKGPDGGYTAFRYGGNDKATFATALSAAGYRTAMLGKYLNGYQPVNPIPPGWATWAVAGNGYPEFNYSLNQDGKIVRYGAAPTDYLTDVLSERAVRFIKGSAGTPFIIEVATFAPHRPSTPAPRDADALPGLRAPRSPAFDAAPDANAVSWLRWLPALSAAEMDSMDAEYRRRAQSVLAVDKMIGELQAAVAAIGAENNTYFVFSSDNGYHLGEHRMLAGKQTAFDTDIHVPLVVTGPGVPPGAAVDEVAQNTDLCPTFAELAGATAAANVEGRSLVPLLKGQKPADWRALALVEHHGHMKWDAGDPDAMDLVDEPPYTAANRRPWQRGQRHGNAPSYEAIRGRMWVYVEYVTGEKEYHDLATDPDELRNRFPSLSSALKASLHTTLAAVQNCHDAASCRAAEHSLVSTDQQ